MRLPIYIAKRYLVSKKSHNIINIISGISVAGITIGTMALIIVLSVFNGFENLVISLFNTFNPDLQIRIKEGKTFDLTNIPVDEIKNIPGVISFTEVVEENALLKYQDKQHIVMLKGVSESFLNNNPLDSMMIDGEFIMESGDLDFAILGAGVAYFLGVNLQDYTSPVTVYVPSRTRSATLSFEGAFNQKNILPVGVFSVQQDFDIKYVILPLDFTGSCWNMKASSLLSNWDSIPMQISRPRRTI